MQKASSYLSLHAHTNLMLDAIPPIVHKEVPLLNQLFNRSLSLKMQQTKDLPAAGKKASQVDIDLTAYKKQLELSGMQNPGLCCSFKLTLEMAKLLVDEEGDFQSAYLSPLLKKLDSLFGRVNVPPFVTTIRKHLKMLQSPQANKGILSIFNHLFLPEKMHPRCAQLIRATLVQGESQPLTNRDARIVFLKYLLDEPRQGDTGTCYADCWHIALSKMRPDIVATDVADLLVYGAFFRTYLDTPHSLDFTPYMISSSLQQSIQIDQTGRIQSPGNNPQDFIPFNQAPGIQAALIQMNIPLDDSEITTKVLARLLNGQEGLVAICAQQIIEAYAEVCPSMELFELEPLELINKGIYGYVALEASPPHQAMTSAIASASQYTDRCRPKNLLIECVQSVFSEEIDRQSRGLLAATFSLVGWQPKSAQPDEWKIVSQVFEKQLSQFIQLQYGEASGSTTDAAGRFILHQRNLKKRPIDASLGKKIWNERPFQAFIEKVIAHAEEAYQAENPSDPTKKVGLAIFEKMKVYAKTPAFMTKIKQTYDPKHPENLPWRTSCGGSPVSTALVYLNGVRDPLLFKEIRHAEDASALLDWYFEHIFSFSMQSQVDVPRFYNGSCQAPGIGHAFNWMLDHPSVLELVRLAEQEGMQQALADRLQEPGDKVADFPVTDIPGWLDKLKKAVLNAYKAPVEALPFFSPQDQAEGEKVASPSVYQKKLLKAAAERLLKEGKLDEYIQELLNTLHTQLMHWTVYTLSQKVISALEKDFNRDQSKILSDAFLGLVTTAVLDHLPDAAYENIAVNALHVADSNWKATQENDFPKNIHFACFYNPVTKSLFLGELTQDNQNLKPLPVIKTFQADLQDLRKLQAPSELSPIA